MKLLAMQTELQQTIDWSLPGDPVPVGTRHPLSIVRNQIVSIFKSLGFAVAEGPEIEDDWHNFTALKPSRKSSCTRYAGYFLPAIKTLIFYYVPIPAVCRQG